MNISVFWRGHSIAFQRTTILIVIARITPDLTTTSLKFICNFPSYIKRNSGKEHRGISLVSPEQITILSYKFRGAE
jgi:hypothetical protein